ncbi:MAG: peptide-methionine (R)-S-oxide reductase MsrB [bacterium]|nr:peptide-methionine (R)-S-oxide reductase MsrB [bacterium]
MDTAAPQQPDVRGADERELTPEQRRIMWEGGTEPPFSGAYWDTHAPGMYRCASCGAEIFSSTAKFDSGTGWPSFTEPANRARVTLVSDAGHGMQRTEVRCAACGAHLGHVFDDGPEERGGKRYCINSTCLLHDRQPPAAGDDQDTAARAD